MRPEVAWTLWPANILVVSVLLYLPRRLWPVLLAAALATYAIYDLQIGIPIRSIIFFQLADATEIVTAALGLSYCFDGVPQLDSVKALPAPAFSFPCHSFPLAVIRTFLSTPDSQGRIV
jgi:hypothetical protein